MTTKKSGRQQPKAFITHKRFIAATIATGVFAMVAIGGVQAWVDSTSTSSSTVASKPAARKQAVKSERQEKPAPASRPAEQTDQPVTVIAGSQDNDTVTAVHATADAASQPAVMTAAVTAPTTSPLPTPSPATFRQPELTPDAPATNPAPISTVASVVDPAKFERPIVSMTFDDGWKSIYSAGIPRLGGLPSTQYLNSAPIMGGFEGYMSPQDIRDLSAAGHEIAWHTASHADLASLDSAGRQDELQIPQAFLSSLMNVNISKNLASPYGSYGQAQDAETQAEVLQDIRNAGFTSHRSTDEGYNGKTADGSAPNDVNAVVRLTTDNIRVKNILDATSVAEVQSWVDKAIATNSWLVIVYHEVKQDTDASVEDYSVTPENLEAQVNYIKSTGVSVKTVQAALDELNRQL